MTPAIPKPGLKRFGKLGTKSIDMLALAAALSWIGAMVSLSWWATESSVIVWLVRGGGGAIFIYIVIFLILHAVVLKPRAIGGASEFKDKGRAMKQQTEPPLKHDERGEAKAGKAPGDVT